MTLASEASSHATSPVLPPSDDSASEEALTGGWVLQQVQIGNGYPGRRAQDKQTCPSKEEYCSPSTPARSNCRPS